jgi:hypothetical protein
MVNPAILCDKHLLGEHVECHMFACHLLRKRKITNYIAFNLLEPKSLKQRHALLANQMRKRTMSHKSPLPRFSISYLPKYQQDYEVDVEKSLKDLIKRCPACKKRFKTLSRKR